MDLQRIVSDLKRERERIDRAIEALEGAGMTVAKRRSTASTPGVTRKSSKRRMSAQGRKRISEAMKKRWAARRRGNGRKLMPKAA